MGNMSRDKGQRGERAVAKLLQPVIDKVKHDGDIQIVRNLDQTRDGGYDLKGVPWLAMEVKWQETLCVNTWWKQTIRQADDDQVPVLIYKQNRKSWKVLMMGYVEIADGKRIKTRVQISLEAFLIWFEQKLIRSIGNERTRDGKSAE